MSSPLTPQQSLSPYFIDPLGNEENMEKIEVPVLLRSGFPLLKLTSRGQEKCVIKIDPDQFLIVLNSRSQRIIPIETIQELRSGANARYYRELFQLSQDFEERWLTISYISDGKHKMLHLVTETEDEFQIWDGTLRRLHTFYQLSTSWSDGIWMRQAMLERRLWEEATRGAIQKLDFDHVKKLCRRLNLAPDRGELLKRFQVADANCRGYLDIADFRRLVKLLNSRSEIDQLYQNVTKDYGGRLNYPCFEKFMRQDQKSSLSDAELQGLFVRYASASIDIDTSDLPPPTCQGLPQHASGNAHKTPESPVAVATPEFVTPVDRKRLLTAPGIWETGVIQVKAFTAFLMSLDNAAFSDHHGKVNHDMTRPLPEYFISSSHNTYLMGHQLIGKSSIEAYIRALLHSCRCIELDIHNGEEEPMIYHGRTLTSKVSLRDVCKVIAKYAFVTSPYPIIISADICCGLAQQAMTASIMKEEFGDALVTTTIDGKQKIESLPSPEDLKGRILLKARNLYVIQEGIQQNNLSDETESYLTKTSSSDTNTKKTVKQRWKKAVVRAFDRGSTSRIRLPKVENASANPNLPTRTSQVKMSFELVALLIYTVGIIYRGIKEYPPEHLFSLSENAIKQFSARSETMIDLIHHSRTHLVRTYPKGTRFASTNFEPHRHWAVGAQLVALNWQTKDVGYMINHAMFQRNGRAGYVLKPLALRTMNPGLLMKRTEHFLAIRIISAQHLPRPGGSSGSEIAKKSILDPMVEVSMHIPHWCHSPCGSNVPDRDQTECSSMNQSVDTTEPCARTYSARTSTMKTKGFNPVWEEDLRLPFDCVGDMRDLIFVRFAVRQGGRQDGKPLATFCCSLGSLNLGYRHLPLYDSQLSQLLFSTLFVKIDVHDV